MIVSKEYGNSTLGVLHDQRAPSLMVSNAFIICISRSILRLLILIAKSTSYISLARHREAGADCMLCAVDAPYLIPT
ncbi:hypothetical protein GJV44_00737 [Candidatus Vallotia cooleyia]|nr:hypothetical protein GJV44_00737 [Candidatus Vallotia cooleyia]